MGSSSGQWQWAVAGYRDRKTVGVGSGQWQWAVAVGSSSRQWQWAVAVGSDTVLPPTAYCHCPLPT
ncbi:MAG: hypothetical protein KA165_01580, partial [Saprospiraceae bacterium]|nr:hypothetical protein [Saprospiraceae bacterium]